MNSELKIEVQKFRNWSKNVSNILEDERGGEWEQDYTGWNKLSQFFVEFIEKSNYEEWKNEDIDNILYLIARDNEMEDFISEVVKHQTNSLKVLAEKSFDSVLRDAKWQIAINIDKYPDKKIARKILEYYLEDKDEYVRRRALMTIAKLSHPKIEEFCERAWNDENEYQRIAVLHSLKAANSPKLSEYYKKAINDGRKYLLMNVDKLRNNK